MRKAKLRLGRLCLLDIEGGAHDGAFEHNDDRFFLIFAGGEQDKEGRLTHLFWQPCSSKEAVERYKDDPLFDEPVHLEVWSLDGKEEVEKLYDFDGTLYDALLIAANEGKKYDV